MVCLLEKEKLEFLDERITLKQLSNQLVGIIAALW
jgi:hypothetical protein